MNNKRKQQWPSTVPVKFLVLVLKDVDRFLPAFPAVSEMQLDILSLAAARLPALQTRMGQVYTGLTRITGGWGWTKCNSQWHSCMWGHFPAFGCRRHPLAKIRVFVVLKRQGEGGSPSVWVSGAVWRDWQSLCNAKPKEGQLHFFLDLDSAAKRCAFLCSACPGSKFLLGRSSWFIRVPFPSSDGGCRDWSTKMHKAARCINAWNSLQLECCCHFPLSAFLLSCP